MHFMQIFNCSCASEIKGTLLHGLIIANQYICHKNININSHIFHNLQHTAASFLRENIKTYFIHGLPVLAADMFLFFCFSMFPLFYFIFYFVFVLCSVGSVRAHGESRNANESEKCRENG